MLFIFVVVSLNRKILFLCSFSDASAVDIVGSPVALLNFNASCNTNMAWHKRFIYFLCVKQHYSHFCCHRVHLSISLWFGLGLKAWGQPISPKFRKNCQLAMRCSPLAMAAFSHVLYSFPSTHRHLGSLFSDMTSNGQARLTEALRCQSYAARLCKWGEDVAAKDFIGQNVYEHF